MSTTAPARISRRALAHAVGVRLATVTNATGYLGEITAMTGLPGATETPDHPPAKGNGDLRVQPYFILFPGIGTPSTETDLGETFVDLDWPWQVTAAAGDIDDLLALVDRIDAALHRWRPGLITTPGADPVLTGQVTHPAGYSPTVAVDRDVTPPRHFTPLQYQLTAHT